jgi:phosphoribosylformylglycinamidine cyclo-ligase
VKLDRINTGKGVRAGSLVIGLESSGVHSNGLTLARKILLGESPEAQKENAFKYEDKLGRTLGEELLEPTRIYVQPILELIDSGLDIQAMVHITGGGFLNLTRVESDNIRFVIESLPPAPAVFQLIQDSGEVSDAEMYDVFNMGIGFCVVVEGTNEVEQVTEVLKKYDIACHVIGHVEAHHGKDVTLPEKNLISQNGKFVPTPVGG